MLTATVDDWEGIGAGAESGWMSMGTTSVATWEDLGEGVGGLMMDCDNLATD